ncbi:MAG: hypothetical protein ACK5B6_01160 [Bacteroidia bacterium]
MRTALFVAAAGTTMPGIAVLQIAAPAAWATSATSISGSGWLSSRSAVRQCLSLRHPAPRIAGESPQRALTVR